MKAWRQFLFPFLALLVLSVPSPRYERTSALARSSECGTPLVNVRSRSPLRSPTEDMTSMWLGTWKSLKYRGLSGLVKATMFEMDQKVGVRVELERTILGDVIIHESVISMGRVFVMRGSCDGHSCFIQGWLRKTTILSGFYRIRDPLGKQDDWGSFQAEPLEPPKGSRRA